MSQPPQQLPPPIPTDKSIARHKEAVEDARCDLKNSQFYSRLIDTLTSTTSTPPLGTTTTTTTTPSSRLLTESITSFVMYGLGSLDQPGAVHIRYQLALACQLIPLFTNLSSSPEAFDPAFTPHDHAVLPLLGISVLQRNEGGKRVVRQPTFFFMPHCEAELTEGLLAVNERAGTLHNVVILGNSFRKYQERWCLLENGGGGKEQRRPETMLKLLESGLVREIEVQECGFPVTAAFNDMSLHMFTKMSV